MRLDAGSYPILYAKIYRNVMHDGHKGFGMNGEYLDVYHNTGFESRTMEHVQRDPYTDLSNPRGDLNFRIDNSPMEDMNRHSTCMNNAVDVMDPRNDSRLGVMKNRGPDWKGLSEGVPIRGQLRDPDNRDFRPWQSGSVLVDAGTSLKNKSMRWALRLAGMTSDDVPVNISEQRSMESAMTEIAGEAPDMGAYEAGGSYYWIPGFRGDSVSHPIPSDAAQDVRDNVQLIFRPALQSREFRVYFSTDKAKIADGAEGSRKAILASNENIFTPEDLEPDTTYYWRVDTVLDENKGRIEKGELWTFTTGAFEADLVVERPVYSIIPSGGTDVLAGGQKKNEVREPVMVRYLLRNRGTASLELAPDQPVKILRKNNCEIRIAAMPRGRTVPPGAAVFFDLEVVSKEKEPFSADIRIEWRPSRDRAEGLRDCAFGISGNRG